MKKIFIILILAFTIIPVFARIELVNEDYYKKPNKFKNIKNKAILGLKDFLETPEEKTQRAIMEDLEIVALGYKANFEKGNEALKKESGYNWHENLSKDENAIDKIYNAYLKNKNNMENNRLLYESTKDFSEDYEKLLKDFEEGFKKLYADYTKRNKSDYLNINDLANYRQAQNIKIPTYESFKYYILEETPEASLILDKMQKNQKQWNGISKEVYNYSYAYEAKKAEDYYKANNKKKICGSIAEFIYSPYSSAPRQECLYDSKPGLGYILKVFQVLPSGILLTGDWNISYTHGNADLKNLYIQTSKKYITGQFLNDYEIFEYKGIYNYKTILSSSQNVWSFYRLGKIEIDNNFKTPFTRYFYAAY